MGQLPLPRFAVLAFGAIVPVQANPGVHTQSPTSTNRTLTYLGQVFDRATLRPIEGARVRRFDGKVEVITDSKGEFAFPIEADRFGSCRFGGGKVECSRDDPDTTRFVISAQAASPVVVAPGRSGDWNSRHSIALWRKATVQGTWLDAKGRPCEGRELELTGAFVIPWGCHVEFDGLKTSVGRDGHFVFESVPADVSWTLRPVQSEDEIVDVETSGIHLAAGEVRTLNLCSPQTRHVYGVVRSGDQPQAGAEVWLSISEDRYLTDTTDEQGRFGFMNVGVGTYDLKAFFQREYEHVIAGVFRKFRVESGDDDLELNLALQPIQRIQGQVVDPQHVPFQHEYGGLEVWSEPETNPYTGRINVEPDGTFVLNNVFPGNCRLMATDDLRARGSPVRTVQAGANGVELILERGGSLSGSVSSTEHISSGNLHLDLKFLAPGFSGRDLGPRVSVFREDEVLKNGRFTLPGLPAGKWSVQAAFGDDLASAIRYVRIEADREASLPDLVVKPASPLLLLAPPGSADAEVEIDGGDGLLARITLDGESMRRLVLPAGEIRVIGRRGGTTFDDRTVSLHPQGPELVGVGFDR